MKTDEKDEIMTRFKNGEIDILVSTTVVEVGVDVPNATTIVILDAESFGLAQLHQLRGRVGRGEKESECFLVVKDDKEPSLRIRELEKSTDGFHLAEVDLKLRGPGEIYGKLQHGMLNLKIATLSDTKTISKAQKAAEKFVAEFAKDPETMLKYKELASEIKKYQQLTTLN
jgi:ATP-dependent DNA helicase RecG